ncbi:MAG TPA: sarcosine oxidase subunit gamma family protein [Solirubrobacteraceae bacterium]|nr:sarcosine oxidase subunit gamma family protein [Solirubrobacteraceae bacterium]
MASTEYRQSPLHDLADRLGLASEFPERIRLAEVPFLTQLTLRLNPGASAARAAARVLGVNLPTAPNTTSAGGEVQVLWMGPDEWLVVAPEGAGERLCKRLEAALEGHHASVVDVSAQRTVVEFAGADARELLLKGCPLDLHPRAFAPGRCAQSTLARAQVVLLARSEEPAYWVFVRSSFAEYLAEWLLDAAAEYRGAPPLHVSLAVDPQLIGVPA